MTSCDKYGCPIYGCPVKVYDIETTRKGLTITLPDTTCPIQNGQTAEFIICTRIVYPECVGDVKVSINGTEFTLIKVGNVKTDQIKCRTKYRIILATESETATVDNCLPRSKFPFPEIAAPAAE